MKFPEYITENDDDARRRKKSYRYKMFQKGRNRRYRFALCALPAAAQLGNWIVFIDAQKALFEAAKYRILGADSLQFRIYRPNSGYWSEPLTAKEFSDVVGGRHGYPI